MEKYAYILNIFVYIYYTYYTASCVRFNTVRSCCLQYEEAVKFYKEAQLEHQTVKVSDQLRKAEKKVKQAAANAYLDPAKGLEAKERGNEKFKGGDFPAAIAEYSEAIKRDPTNAVYYNNRSAAYMKLGKRRAVGIVCGILV